MSDFITIRGARENHLKDVTVDVPTGVLTTIISQAEGSVTGAYLLAA